MKTFVGLFFVLHGIVHLLGFVVPWRIVRLEDAPYKTTLLAGRLDAGAVGIRIVGVLWLVAAVAFVASGVGVQTAASWWRTMAIVAAAVSFALGVLSWPDAPIGVALNLAILAVLLLDTGLGPLPGRVQP